MKYTPEEMVRRAHSAIFRDNHWCWLTQVVLLGNWVIEDRAGRPWTDGYNVNYSLCRINELTERSGDKGIRYIVLHENGHKALRHMTTWKSLWKKNKDKANYAMDVVINNFIAETPEFATVPEDSVFRPEWKGLNVGEVWDRMTDNDEDGGGQGDDDHKEFVAGVQPGDEEGDAQGKVMQTTDAQVDALMQSAVQQGLFMQRQKCPESARKFGALVNPKVDWKKALAAWLQQRQWGHDLANWKRRSRRGMALNTPLPIRYQERTGRLVLAIDTSGSIRDEELMAFVSEVGSLAMTLKPTQVEIVYWGSDVIQPHETYLPAQYSTMTRTTRPKDGGGTHIMAVRDFLKTPAMKGVTGCVVLTDGHVGAWGEGSWPCPMFVVLNINQPCPMAHVRI